MSAHSPAPGDCSPRTVVFRRIAPAILWLTLATGEVVGTTPGHEVWTFERGWGPAAEYVRRAAQSGPPPDSNPAISIIGLVGANPAMPIIGASGPDPAPALMGAGPPEAADASAIPVGDPPGESNPAIAIIGATGPPAALVVPESAGQRSRCEPYRAVILTKLEQGLSAQRIWQDLRSEQGFADSYQFVQRFVRRLRATTPLPCRRVQRGPGARASRLRLRRADRHAGGRGSRAHHGRWPARRGDQREGGPRFRRRAC